VPELCFAHEKKSDRKQASPDRSHGDTAETRFRSSPLQEAEDAVKRRKFLVGTSVLGLVPLPLMPTPDTSYKKTETKRWYFVSTHLKGFFCLITKTKELLQIGTLIQRPNESRTGIPRSSRTLATARPVCRCTAGIRESTL